MTPGSVCSSTVWGTEVTRGPKKQSSKSEDYLDTGHASCSVEHDHVGFIQRWREGVGRSWGWHNQHWEKVCLISSSTFPSNVGSSHLASMDTVSPEVLTNRQTWWPWIDLLYIEAQESILSTTEKWWWKQILASRWWKGMLTPSSLTELLLRSPDSNSFANASL